VRVTTEPPIAAVPPAASIFARNARNLLGHARSGRLTDTAALDEERGAVLGLGDVVGVIAGIFFGVERCQRFVEAFIR
jgi:hypothetical protein